MLSPSINIVLLKGFWRYWDYRTEGSENQVRLTKANLVANGGLRVETQGTPRENGIKSLAKSSLTDG